MRGVNRGFGVGLWLAAFGALAIVGVLALSSAASPSQTVSPNLPLVSPGEPGGTAHPTEASATASSFEMLPTSAPNGAPALRIRQELQGWEEPAEFAILTEGVSSPFLDGGPDPIPTDAPFGTNIQVENAAGTQVAISVAASGNTVFVAYQHPSGPPNGDDIRFA